MDPAKSSLLGNSFLDGAAERSRYSTGLETGNTYAIANVSGTGTNLSISVVNASGLARIQAAWSP
jgi:hypothetical protein